MGHGKSTAASSIRPSIHDKLFMPDAGLWVQMAKGAIFGWGEFAWH
jgi:hypothetical protein